MTAHPILSIPFFHVRLSGDPYLAGYHQGQALAAVPGWIEFLGSGAGKLIPSQLDEIVSRFDRFCPGVNAEIHGTADASHLPVEAIIYYAATHLYRPQTPIPGCSHIVILPGRSADGHVRVGRNYDYSPQADDCRLVTTHFDGTYAHIGFSLLLFGRCEGMNEHGLSVTVSSGGIPVGSYQPAITDGFQFWALCRSLLERCRDIDEAMEWMAEFPMAGNPVFLLADRRGAAALIEMHGDQRAVKHVAPGEAIQCLYATNHYQLPEMQVFQPAGRLAHSVHRNDTIARFLETGDPVGGTDLKHLLAETYPDGLCCHHYGEFFGAMHSMMFDLTSGEAQICFGSPAANPYHTLTLDSIPQPEPYLARLTDEKADPHFWELV